MKAVVLEVRDGMAAVLLEDQTIRRIRCDCEVGDTIEIHEAKKQAPLTKRATRWVAAAVAALVLVSGGSYGYNNAYAYSYVTLDAESSIEFVLNRKNEVLRVSALNDDAVPVVEELTASSVRGMAFAEVLEEAAALLPAPDADCLLISVSSRGETQREHLNAEIEAFKSRDEAAVYVANATVEDGKAARSLGMSTGRYVLMEEANAANGASPADFDTAPVTELIERSGRAPIRESEPETQPTDAPQAPQTEQNADEPSDAQNAPSAEPETQPAQAELSPGGDQSASGEPGQ